jgi:hypothetical protein
MAKPWGKYEIDFLDHPKFRALHANTIVLWLEAKNYCDKFLTDGRFPVSIEKTFRHYSEKAVAQLTRSCGVKPNGEPYTPLWEAQDIGGVAYHVMHDYLLHNDCRDVVQRRIAKAERDAAEKAQRQKDYRDKKKAERSMERSGNVLGNAGHNATGTQAERSAIVPDKQKQLQKQLQPPSEVGTARSKRPMFVGQRLTVFEWQVEECVGILGPHADAFHLDEWFFALDHMAVARGLVIPKRDGGEWLQAQLVAEAQRRGIPLRLATAATPALSDTRAIDEAALERVRQKEAR